MPERLGRGVKGGSGLGESKKEILFLQPLCRFYTFKVSDANMRRWYMVRTTLLSDSPNLPVRFKQQEFPGYLRTE